MLTESASRNRLKSCNGNKMEGIAWINNDQCKGRESFLCHGQSSFEHGQGWSGAERILNVLELHYYMHSLEGVIAVYKKKGVHLGIFSDPGPDSTRKKRDG